MSISLMSAAWELDIGSTEKLVLLALADWSNDDGICWPSIAKLCRKSGLSERAVRQCIGRLCDAKHLSREERPGKGVTYTVHPRNSATPARRAPGTRCPRHDMPPAPDARTPARRAPNTPVTTNTLSDASHLQGDVAGATPLRAEHVVEAWNELADRKGLAKVKALTPERQRKLRSRIRAHSIEDFTEAISAIERSPFLLGDNPRAWRANFDFLLQPSSFQKLIEGSYDRGN